MPKSTLHQHREAFCLMQYEGRGSHGVITEWIWNSRDGVTPFGVRDISGNFELLHVRWNQDRYAPNHVPKGGDRIFVDLTRKRAEQLALVNARRWWESNLADCQHQFDSVEDMAEMLATSYLDTEGAPDLIMVEG